MKQIFVTLFLSFVISLLSLPIFSQSPVCANFSGVFISDSLEQNLPEYYVCNNATFYLKSLNNLAGATYQWKRNGINIVGETNSTILIQNIGIFSLTMTVGECTATSSGIVIYVGSPFSNSTINTNGITQACSGDTITLLAPKGLGFAYQWFKDNNLISNATTANYKATQTGNYKVTVEQGSCVKTLNPVALTFNNIANPIISTTKTIICEGKTTTLKASNVNSSHTLQWVKDGISIAGMNKDSLVVSQTGNYSLQTTKNTCTGNSNGLNISITNLNLPAPQIQKDYLNAFETCANNIVKLKVKDYTDGNLTWLKDGNIISGETAATLTTRESGNYAVRYSGNELCFSQSAVIPVKITDVSTATFSPNNITVPSYNSQAIHPVFTGTSPYAYTINNVRTDIVTNPNTYNFINTLNTQTLTITQTATACGVGTASGPATITLGSCTTPTQVSINISNNPVCIGGSTTISAVAQGVGTLTYQWRKNGVTIANETSNTLTISNFNYADIAKYSVSVTGGCGTVVSNTDIQVNANYGDVVFAKLAFPAYLNSEIALKAFSGSSSGNSSNAYSWTGPNNFTSNIQNPSIVNSTSANSGVYKVIATNVNGCINYALLNVNLTSAPPIIIGDLGFTSFCPNATARVHYTTTLPSGSLMNVYLSDAYGNFDNQIFIGSGNVSPINIQFPLYATGTKYRIRITSSTFISNFSGYLSSAGQTLFVGLWTQKGQRFDSFDPEYSPTLCAGTAITLTLKSNLPDVDFEWKRNGVVVSNVATYRVSQAGSYVMTAKKGSCNSASRNIGFSFNSSVVNYVQRKGAIFQCDGVTSTLRSYYVSDSAIYQWKRNGTTVIGATTDTLATTQSGTYEVNVFDKCNVIDRSNQYKKNTLIFSNSIENPITAKQTVFCSSGSAEMYSSLNYSNNPLARYTYQWKKNGVDIPNAIYNSIRINEAGVYSLALSQGNCTSVSKGVVINKVDTLKLGLFLQSPYSKEVCQGMYVNVVPSNAGTFQTAIYKDNILFKNYPQSEVEIRETGNYTLRYIGYNNPGCIYLSSDTLKISVGNKFKPTLYSYKSSFCSANNTDSPHILIDNSYGLPTPTTYQWFKGNIPVVGATYAVLTTRQAGFYKLRVAAGACTGFSDSVEVKSVSQLPKPIIYDSNFQNINTNSSNILCANNISVMYGINDGSRYTNVNYDSLLWKKDGQIIARLAFDKPFYLTQAGTYSIIGKGVCQTESDPVEIKIGEPITANITGSTSIYPGQKANLNINFTGGNAWLYQTSDVTTGLTTSLSPTLKTVSPSSTQTYAITSVASNCGVGMVSGNATVTILPCLTDKTISINSGNWNNSTTWSCGQIPTSTLDAIIEQGHVVNLPNGYQGKVKKLELKGGINQGVGASIIMNN
ncbi:MAG: hypothetical protein QE277_01575 [Flectobacillus sp.]|nr:hypothetical protein [Flectobacillus sp.]